MKTPQQIKNEVEKEISFLSLRIENMPLGKDQDILVKRRNGLRDKFSILTEYDKSIKEIIDKHLRKWTEKWITKRVTGRCVAELKELLSKIGDNSEVEK